MVFVSGLSIKIQTMDFPKILTVFHFSKIIVKEWKNLILIGQF